MNTAEEEVKNGQSEGAKRRTTGAKQPIISTSGKGRRNTVEVMEGSEKRVIQSKKEESRQPGEEKKQKPKKRVKEEERNRGAVGAVQGRKRPRLDGDQDGQIAKGKKEKGKQQVVGRKREKRMRDDKRLTTVKFDTRTDVSGSESSPFLTDNDKDMQSKVKSLKASVDQKTHRDEQEGEREETVPEKESVDERKNRSVCREKDEEEKEESISDQDEYVVWVQCSRADCSKWRRLSEDVDPSALPDNWTCENNPDPEHCRCSAPEQQSSSDEKQTYFCSLVPGSLVWVKQNRHLWWPAVIERDPDTGEYLEFHKETDLAPYKCHVTYFGEPVCIGWVLFSDVRNYTDLTEDKISEQKNIRKDLKDAICMSKQALELPPQTRLIKFGFWSRYESDQENSEEDSEIEDDLELYSGKRGKYSDDEYVLPKHHRRALNGGEEKRRRRGKSGSKKHKNGNKEKSGHENGKSVRKKMEKDKGGAKRARNSEGGQKADGLMEKEELEKKRFTPSFSLVYSTKNKPVVNPDADLDQTVPQRSSDTSPDSDSTQSEERKGEKEKDECGQRERIPGDEEEDGERRVNSEKKQRRWKLKSWRDAFSEEEEENDGEVWSCRKKGLELLSCREEEEEEEEGQGEFSLLLMEEEE
ncbi:zinc finger CW-type PWWP domain protein 1-like isoform X2 [Hoplias malabaricus]